MKKIITIMLTLLLTLNLTACGTNNNEGNNYNENSTSQESSDYSYSIKFNEKTFNLPISYEKLKETTGLSLKESDTKKTLSPGQTLTVNLFDNDGNFVCYAILKNETNDSITRDKGTIIDVIQNIRQVELGASKFVFAKGLYVGMEMNLEEQQKVKSELEENEIILTITLKDGYIESLGYVHQ